MKRKFLSIILIFAMLLPMFPATALAADTEYYKGAAAGGTYTISSPEQLKALAETVNEGTTYANTTFKLTNSIGLGGDPENQWDPIGSSYNTPFSGTFDGGSHEITGLYIDTNNDYQGLFGAVKNGTIKDLSVDGIVRGGGDVGGIVGYMYLGTMEKCSFSGEVVGGNGSDTADEYIGGIAGENYTGTIRDCHNSGSVSSTTSYVGGVVGVNYSGAEVINCTNTGRVTISAAAHVGGIAGFNNMSSKIINCYNGGDVNGAESKGYIGGIAGRNAVSATIERSYNTAQVTGSNYVGGIAGQNEDGTVRNCYNEGDVISNSDGGVGGIVGRNNSGDNTSKLGSVSVGTVSTSYNRGAVSGSKSGSIVGVNSAISSTTTKNGKVLNCYYLTNTAGGGIAGSDADGQAEAKTPDQFGSGEVTWLLQHGQSSQSTLIWGQELVNTPTDQYPLLVALPEGSDGVDNARVGAVPRVLKVTFKANTNDVCKTGYTNNEGTIVAPDAPETDENHVFYEWRIDNENGKTYEGLVVVEDPTIEEVIVAAVQREKYAGEQNVIVVTTTYSLEDQSLDLYLDHYMSYADGTSPDGKFTYKINPTGNEILKAVLPEDGNKLSIPENAPANEEGYLLTVTAHEESPAVSVVSPASASALLAPKPLRSPFSPVSPFALSGYDTKDVTLKVKVIINKATPDIDVVAKSIDYGAALSTSTFTTATAKHPGTDTEVAGDFAWADDNASSIIPEVEYAGIVGYPVTFTPTNPNYNSVTLQIKLMVNKVKPSYNEPTANNTVYNTKAQDLVNFDPITGTENGVEGGTMKFWLEDPTGTDVPDSSEFSSKIPARANAGDYKVWYMVIGDSNHNDVGPIGIEVTISKADLAIPAQTLVYNGSSEFPFTFDGVKDKDGTVLETVDVVLKPHTGDAKLYKYADADAEGKYTVEICEPYSNNYAVKAGAAEGFTITPLAVALDWGTQLSFPYTGEMYVMKATVTNAIGDDTVSVIEYTEDSTGTDNKNFTNKAKYAGSYVAEAKTLDNPNYTLDGVLNTAQPWFITKEDEAITLEEVKAITYGDTLTLTANIDPASAAEPSPRANIVRLLANTDNDDKVEFFVNDQPVGEVTVDYDNNDEDSGTATLSIEIAASDNGFYAGPNLVTAKYTGNENVTEATTTTAITVIVYPKELSLKIKQDSAPDAPDTPETITKVYDGSTTATGLKLDIEGILDCDTKEADDLIITAESFTYNSKDVQDASKITANNITMNGTKSLNYTLKEGDVEIAGTITPKPIKLEWRGLTGLVYSGDPANVNITATELVSGDECTVDVENGDKINAGGPYTATAKAPSNPNYKLPDDDKTREYTIEPYSLLIPAQTVKYNSTNEFTVEVDGVTPTGKATENVSIALTASGSDVGEYAYKTDETEPGEPDTIDAGDAETTDTTYTASTDNTNYQIASGAPLTIEKVEPKYTAPTPNSPLTEDGTAQELVTAGKTKDGTMVYALSKDGPYWPEIPTGTEAGTYTVWYKVLGDKNHNDTDPQSVDVTISKQSSSKPGGQSSYVPPAVGDDNPGGEGDDPGKGDGKDPTTPPNVEDNGHGSVEVSPEDPNPGDNTTVTPKPDDGYEVGDVVVKDKDGNDLEVTDNGDGTFSFVWPEGGATICVRFVCARDEHCPIWPFTDASPKAWYHDGVHYCLEKRLMEGIGNNLFAPDDATDRAMIATILWRVAGSPVVNYLMTYEDVEADMWYTEAIRWATSEGVVKGYGDGTFGPTDPITREQLAAMLYRYEQSHGGGFAGDWMFLLSFADSAEISDWAYEALCWCNMNGIVEGKGDNILDPQGHATRAEAATMIMRYLELPR